MHDGTDERPTKRFEPFRRDVMRAVGAGGALGVIGSTTAADDADDETPTPDDEPAEDGETEGTVHTVRTRIEASTNPERPADFFYQPTGLHVEPGDVVRFVFETPDHTVTSYHPAFGMRRRIPQGAEAFSSPVLGWDPDSLPNDVVEPPAEPSAGAAPDEAADAPEPSTWLYAFDVPGVYDIECGPHEGFGMAMRVVAGEETDAAFETEDPEALPEPRAGPVGLARVVLTDPNLQPEAIVDAGRVEWGDLEANQSDGDG